MLLTYCTNSISRISYHLEINLQINQLQGATLSVHEEQLVGPICRPAKPLIVSKQTRGSAHLWGCFLCPLLDRRTGATAAFVRHPAPFAITGIRPLPMLLRFPGILHQSHHLLRWSSCRLSSIAGVGGGEDQLDEFLGYMQRLRNYERSSVPRDAGTDSDEGFDLGRMRRLLLHLGNPHTHFQAVHIAGTKGKGSTAAFLSNILRVEGYNVGCYTSPHLLTIRERISVGKSGGPVSAELLRNLFNRAKEIIDQSIESENGALTHFEVFTALSCLLFSQENVDIAIIEGRNIWLLWVAPYKA